MKLSIITVCYCNLEGLQRTENSIRMQTWRDFEWIVVDGGSDDGTVEYLKSLSPQPDYWVSEPDGGIYDAMNKGLRRAKGEYVLFLNSGDALTGPRSLSELMQPEPVSDVVYGDMNFVGPEGKRNACYSAELDQELLIIEGLPHQSALIRAAVLKAAGGYDSSYRIAADFKFWLQIFKVGRRFEHRHQVVSDFFLGGCSSTDRAQTMLERQRALREVFGVNAADSDYEATKVVVVVPVYKKTPSRAEELSLRQSFRMFGQYEIVICCPDGLDVSAYDDLAGKTLAKERFSRDLFKGLDGYNRLMVDPAFYRRFAVFEYMLICQPDVWIFRDELRQWCEKGYDYVGAPIFTKCGTHEMGERFWGVGNGGLSLRKVSKFISITESGVPAETMEKTGWSEDCVFCFALKATSCSLKLPLAIEAAHFSFERSPQYLFELTGQRLPFGAHAWTKYDFYGFWSRYIPYSLAPEEIEIAEATKKKELRLIRQSLDSCRSSSAASSSVAFAIKWFRGQLKQFVPYGLMLFWLRHRYDVVIDRPLCGYGLGMKLVRRLVKFILPYGLVVARRNAEYGDVADLLTGSGF